MEVRLPDKGYYKLTLNCSLKDHVVGVKQLAPYNKDILTVLCSFISSEPQKLSNAIYETLYGDYVIPANSWGNVADCKGYTDVNASSKNHYVFYFKAK